MGRTSRAIVDLSGNALEETIEMLASPHRLVPPWSPISKPEAAVSQGWHSTGILPQAGRLGDGRSIIANLTGDQG